MYNRVGRVLFIVGRQLQQKLFEKSVNSVVAVGSVSALTFIHKPNNYIFRRNYSDENAEDEPDDSPRLVNLDEDAKVKLKEYLASPENERMHKIIELEIEVLRQNSDKAPSNLRPHHWLELVYLDSRNKRKRYLAFLWSLEKKKENRIKKKELSKQLYRESIEQNEEVSPHKLGRDTMFMRIYDSTMNNMYHNRLMQRIMFGQQLVFDCGYEEYMTRIEQKYCAKQLQLAFAANRIHDDPFDLYLCNADKSGNVMKTFYRSIPTLYDPEFPLHVKTESYLDLFDKSQLIYLTPHCNVEMTKFDHNAVYVIGAFVDKATNQPVSLAKAKKEGLRMMKFPLDRYLQWGCSSGKNLTVNQVVEILLDLRLTGSWTTALKHVPRRKLIEARMAQMQRKLRFSNNEDMEYMESNDNVPLQEIKPKPGYRYNIDHDFKQQYTNRSFRTDYNRNLKSNSDRNIGTNSIKSDEDFSLKARSKHKNKWQN